MSENERPMRIGKRARGAPAKKRVAAEGIRFDDWDDDPNCDCPCHEDGGSCGIPCCSRAGIHLPSRGCFG